MESIGNELNQWAQQVDREIRVNECFGRLVRGELTEEQVGRALERAQRDPDYALEHSHQIEAAAEALTQFKRLGPAEDEASHVVRRSR